jgi:hypothetical protein
VETVIKLDLEPEEWFLERRCLQAEMSAVLGNECSLVGWHVFFWENRTDRAGRDASATIDALVWVNVELVVALVDALDGTNVNASGIFRADAGLSDDECHVDHLL